MILLPHRIRLLTAYYPKQGRGRDCKTIKKSNEYHPIVSRQIGKENILDFDC